MKTTTIPHITYKNIVESASEYEHELEASIYKSGVNTSHTHPQHITVIYYAYDYIQFINIKPF